MSFFFVPHAVYIPQRAPQVNCPECGFRHFLADPPDMYFKNGKGHRMPSYAREWCIRCVSKLHDRLEIEKLVNERRERLRLEAQAAEANQRRLAAEKKAAFEAEQEVIRKQKEYEKLKKIQEEEEFRRKKRADQKAAILKLKQQLQNEGDPLTDSDSSDSDWDGGDDTTNAWSEDIGPDP